MLPRTNQAVLYDGTIIIDYGRLNNADTERPLNGCVRDVPEVAEYVKNVGDVVVSQLGDIFNPPRTVLGSTKLD